MWGQSSACRRCGGPWRRFAYREFEPQRHRDTEKRRREGPGCPLSASLLCVSVPLWFNFLRAPFAFFAFAGHAEQLPAARAGAAAQLALRRLGRSLALRRCLRGLAFFLVLAAGAPAQPELALADIDSQHAHLDLVADLDDILRAVHL